MLIIGGMLYGTASGVHLKEDKPYSYYSLIKPANPFIHQMLVHRAMMKFFSLGFTVVAAISLPETVFFSIMMLSPFFVAVAALTF